MSKGPRDARFEQVGKAVIIVSLFLPLRVLSASLEVCLAHMQQQQRQGRVVRKLVGETGRDWRQGAALFGPAQYRVSSLYCQGNIRRRDGRRRRASRAASGEW